MKKLILLLLIVTSVAFSQFKLDTNMVNNQPKLDPTTKNMQDAYLQLWEKSVKDTLIYLRPKQTFSLTINDTVLTVKLDTITGTGTKRASNYTATYGSGTLATFTLPYNVNHDYRVSLDPEPIFIWRKTSVTNGKYTLQVSTDSLFKTNLVINDSLLVDTVYFAAGRLKNNTTYFARVRVNKLAWTNLTAFMTYPGMKFQFSDRFLIIESVLITTAVNPVNRQVQLRIRYHKVPRI